MLAANTGMVLIDVFFRPFARVLEKMPILMILGLILIYAVIAYIVLKSAYLADGH